MFESLKISYCDLIQVEIGNFRSIKAYISSRCSTPNRFIWGFGIYGSFRLPQMTRQNLYLAHSVAICKQSRGLKQNGSSGVSNARMEAWLREEVVLGHMFKCTKLRDTSSRAQLVLLTRHPVHCSQGGRELMPALFSNREARQHHIWQAAPCMH